MPPFTRRHPISGDCGLRCKVIRDPDIFNRLKVIAQMSALRMDAIGTMEYPTIRGIHHYHAPRCGVDLCCATRAQNVTSVLCMMASPTVSVLLGEMYQQSISFRFL